jgi:hypothetical protein
MLNLTTAFKQKVLTELVAKRKNFGGTDSMFAKQYGINGSVFSRLKDGYKDGLLRDQQWLTIGRDLGVNPSERNWNMARTEVYNIIERDVLFCKTNSKSRICVDDCGIGKTYTARYLSRTLKNCFYVDGSQGKTKRLFIKQVARAIGVDINDKYQSIKDNVKYYLRTLHEPIVIVDEAGDLDYGAFMDLKELWNGTENACAWYLMGADGLRRKIERGINGKKVGYREMFSRLSERFTTTVPTGREDRLHFYKKLITDVLKANMQNTANLNEIVKRCLTMDSGEIGGLRRAESLLIISQAHASTNG